MIRAFYKLAFRFAGWKINGDFSNESKKIVIAIAPHTSNWDFVVGLAARSILRLRNVRFLGKSQLFKPPYGWIFRILGGYPIDRQRREDMVNQVAALFNDHDEFRLALAPEGTRKKVERLKTGFYYIAKKAGVPIIPVGFDFARKEVVIGQPLIPSDNVDADFERLHQFYGTITGKNPELGFP